jgi:hypothetical protein
MLLLLVNKIIIKMTSEIKLQLYKNEIMNMEHIFSRQVLFAIKKTFEETFSEHYYPLDVCVCMSIRNF